MAEMLPPLALGFPLFIRATHILNILFLSLLMRSGLEILSAHPRLYVDDNCPRGSEWLRFTNKKQIAEPFWTGKDEEVPFSAWLALPGRRNLGLGRHWHFFSVAAWIATGVVYVVLLFALDEWRRLIPSSWAIFPDAVRTAWTYLHLQLPPDGHPFNPLQQLTYAAVVFGLAPFSILTGAAMSPAFTARFPWYTRLFRNRQTARSLHFLALCAFVLFTIGHTVMVLWHGLPGEWEMMVLGVEHGDHDRALIVGSVGLFVVLVIHVAATWSSRWWPRRVQHLLEVIDPLKAALLHHLTSRQAWPRSAIAAEPWVNGLPPNGSPYLELAGAGFAGWALDVGGLVEQPQSLTLAELRAMPCESQVTRHCCIQGWSYIAEWTGVPMRALVERCRPLPAARYVIFHAFDDKGRTEPDLGGTGKFYGSVDLELACHPQSLLAYEMNGEPLPIAHGAPLRFRCETQLGFTMVKYLRAIEFVAEYATIGEGQGGWREDVQHYSQKVGI